MRQIVACHCDQCRRASGHFAAATAAARDDLLVEGQVAWFESSPGVRRGFCPTCGSNLFWDPGDGSRISIFAGSLDIPTGLRLVGHIFVSDKSDYYEIPADGLYLTGTSEVALASLHMGEVLEELPLRYAGFSTNFRREAGAAGKDTRGMFRVHQFNKVEMFVFVEPETSWDEHERMLELEERFLDALELPYRVMNVAAGDLGASAAKKFDIEAWFPAQERYREVTSCSNTTDYQARRLGIRYRAERGLEHPHTLNGTMVTDRALLAILENLQGGVPEVLLRYGAPAQIRP